ncbi:Uncharacterized protein ChrSV_4280 [Chromobacterium vaccinii]|nr:Uncharacterized protein ChrSW_4280 [Chromobacterium vaccinii]QND91737.1 Uncharacterized protein ChrSV_4280 [Chromobacterium vaccinii]
MKDRYLNSHLNRLWLEGFLQLRMLKKKGKTRSDRFEVALCFASVEKNFYCIVRQTLCFNQTSMTH